MEFKFKANPQGQIYLNKELRKELGEKMKGTHVFNVLAIYPADFTPKQILKSLDILKQHFQNEVDDNAEGK